MVQRKYTVYLEGGAVLDIRAARFQVTTDGVFFFDGNDERLPDTYISPKAVIAVIPPSPPMGSAGAGFVQANPGS